MGVGWAAIKPQPAPDSTSSARSRPSDTLADTASAGARVYQYIAYPTLQVLTWPIEIVLVPVVRAAISPTQEPIRYFFNENVIDRVRDLVSIGKEEQILLYPTLSLAPGTGTRTGVTLRDNALFGSQTDQLVAYLQYYVNGDYKARAYVTAQNLLGTPFMGKASAYLARMKNASANQPGTDDFFFYSDSSEQYQFSLMYPLPLSFWAYGDILLRPTRLGNAPPGGGDDNIPVSNFFLDPQGVLSPAYRGIGQSFLDRSWSAGLQRDTRNNPNVTLTGDWLNVSYRYHDVDLSHDYQEWNGQYTKYFQLGSEDYEVTPAEERELKTMSVDKFLQQLEYEKLRHEIFSRKVVAVHLYAAQSFEIPGNSMPIYGLQTLGNDTPLRGYDGDRFRDYTVAAISTEYRFPVLRLMDGTLFDEYGVSGHSWGDIDYLNYRNSWGFGVRVRRPDIFLFRAELGFHGLSGFAINMAVDAPF